MINPKDIILRRITNKAALQRFKKYDRNVLNGDIGIELKGEPIGHISMHESSNSIYIGWVHVLEERRGQGISTLALRRILLRSMWKQKTVSLEVYDGDPSFSLYKRLGFVRKSAANKIDMVWRPEENGFAPVQRAGQGPVANGYSGP